MCGGPLPKDDLGSNPSIRMDTASHTDIEMDITAYALEQNAEIAPFDYSRLPTHTNEYYTLDFTPDYSDSD